MAILHPTTPTTEELMAQLEAERAENARLRAQATSGLSIKLHEKGTISVYGLGRFPVSLYLEQWEKLLNAKEQIEEFLVEHAEEIIAKAGGEE